MQLNSQQLEALDQAHDAPPRVSMDGQPFVLLSYADYNWIRNLLPELPEATKVTDPRSGDDYAVVGESTYERFKPFFEEDPVTPEERQAHLEAFGKRVGWNDPAMDVFDEESTNE